MVPDEGESLSGYVAFAPDSGSDPAPDDGPPRILPYALVAISHKEMVTGVEIVLPPERDIVYTYKNRHVGLQPDC